VIVALTVLLLLFRLDSGLVLLLLVMLLKSCLFGARHAGIVTGTGTGTEPL
jgi:hypothetical protein